VNFFKKLGEFSRDDSLLEYSTHERSPPKQGNPEFKNIAELRHPNYEAEPDQVSQVSGHKTPVMGHDSPAFQAEINEKIHDKNKLDFESEDNAISSQDPGFITLISTNQRDQWIPLNCYLILHGT
jgi:hypothetical protein